jgi:hypothetical protein
MLRVLLVLTCVWPFGTYGVMRKVVENRVNKGFLRFFKILVSF